MNIADIKNEIIKLVETNSKECIDPMINGKDFEVNIQLKGRKEDNRLPSNSVAVYLFFYGDDCLKIGQVMGNSNARFQYQHYLPNSNGSTLAKSIINDCSMNGIANKSNIKEWLKTNTDRLDVIIQRKGDKHLNKIVLNFVEGLLQYRFKPRYEK